MNCVVGNQVFTVQEYYTFSTKSWLSSIRVLCAITLLKINRLTDSLLLTWSLVVHYLPSWKERPFSQYLARGTSYERTSLGRSGSVGELNTCTIYRLGGSGSTFERISKSAPLYLSRAKILLQEVILQVSLHKPIWTKVVMCELPTFALVLISLLSEKHIAPHGGSNVRKRNIILSEKHTAPNGGGVMLEQETLFYIVCCCLILNDYRFRLPFISILV